MILGVFLVSALAVFRLPARDRRCVERMLGLPVPASLREVRFRSNEFLGLNPEPWFFLRFRADAAEVQALFEAGGFARSESEFWPSSGPEWWVPDASGTNLVSYSRGKTPHGCVIEKLWWDSSTGDVFYHRSCP